jgi:hypothetical protein
MSDKDGAHGSPCVYRGWEHSELITLMQCFIFPLNEISSPMSVVSVMAASMAGQASATSHVLLVNHEACEQERNLSGFVGSGPGTLCLKVVK